MPLVLSLLRKTYHFKTDFGLKISSTTSSTQCFSFRLKLSSTYNLFQSLTYMTLELLTTLDNVVQIQRKHTSFYLVLMTHTHIAKAFNFAFGQQCF